MSTSYPAEHVADSHKLEADGYVHLFEIMLRPTGELYLKNNETVEWQGKTYEGFDGGVIHLTGVERHTTEKTARPQLTLVNVDGAFSSFVRQGNLDKALVRRLRVLREDLVADNAVYHQAEWFISRVSSLTRHMIVCELRSWSDGPDFILPARMYIPPNFPSVSLS